MFIHQDVKLLSKTWLEDTEKILDSLPLLGVAGVAGCNENGILTNINHGEPPKFAGTIYIDKPTKVQTLDECLIITPITVFNNILFDEITCDDWHLYTVDYCLSCIIKGFNVYVIPTNTYHSSKGYKMYTFLFIKFGTLPKKYYYNLKKINNKYKYYYEYIYTTFGRWDTKYPLIFQRLSKFLNARMHKNKKGSY